MPKIAVRFSIIFSHFVILRQCPQIGQQYGVQNKAAIALQCKLNGKLIAAFGFIPSVTILVLFKDIADS